MTKDLSLKIKDKIFEDMELTIKSLHVSRNTYINEAVSFYNEFNRRKYLQKKLHKESLRLRNNSVKILREMEKIYSE
jgi:hypothetical protein